MGEVRKIVFKNSSMTQQRKINTFEVKGFKIKYYLYFPIFALKLQSQCFKFGCQSDGWILPIADSIH
jgi:hypothetical protein